MRPLGTLGGIGGGIMLAVLVARGLSLPDGLPAAGRPLAAQAGAGAQVGLAAPAGGGALHPWALALGLGLVLLLALGLVVVMGAKGTGPARRSILGAGMARGNDPPWRTAPAHAAGVRRFPPPSSAPPAPAGAGAGSRRSAGRGGIAPLVRHASAAGLGRPAAPADDPALLVGSVWHLATEAGMVVGCPAAAVVPRRGTRVVVCPARAPDARVVARLLATGRWQRSRQAAGGVQATALAAAHGGGRAWLGVPVVTTRRREVVWWGWRMDARLPPLVVVGDGALVGARVRRLHAAARACGWQVWLVDGDGGIGGLAGCATLEWDRRERRVVVEMDMEAMRRRHAAARRAAGTGGAGSAVGILVVIVAPDGAMLSDTRVVWSHATPGMLPVLVWTEPHLGSDPQAHAVLQRAAVLTAGVDLPAVRPRGAPPPAPETILGWTPDGRWWEGVRDDA